MTSNSSITAPVVWVAIDVAKLTHQVLIELPKGKRRTMRVANAKAEIDGFVEALRALGHRCEIAFEPTGDYHRPLAYESIRSSTFGSSRIAVICLLGLMAAKRMRTLAD